MIQCLLCGIPLKSRITYYDLFFLIKKDFTVCLDCKSQFKRISEQHCPICYQEGSCDICSDCHYWEKKGQLIQHQALYRYNDEMKDYFSRYKFQGDYLLKEVFADEIRDFLRNYRNYDIVPLPVSPERYQERGFHQVQSLLEAAKVPYKNLLAKMDTDKQSGKTREERLQTKQSFYYIYSGRVPEKVLLVDDIYTTSKTLQLAKSILEEVGIKKIRTFSLAR